jgi:hypothetical protein
VAPGPLTVPRDRDPLPAQPSAFVLGPGPAPVADPERPAPLVTRADAAAFVLAARDAAPTAQDPMLLRAPVPDLPRALPEPQPVPPPGLRIRIDARGLAVPTPEGALSPGGHLVYLGRPDLVPPVRPQAGAPSPAVAADAALVRRLAQLRPPARPAGLVPATPLPAATVPPGPDGIGDAGPGAPEAAPDGGGGALAAALDEAALRAPQGPDLPRTPPLPRPERLAALAPQVAPGIFVNPTARAVERAGRPAGRPAGFDAIVAAAALRAVPAPPPAAQPPATADAAPGSDDYGDGEPEVAASAAPRIPSSASVARQATLSDALNLGEVNLIGVFGTSSDRRALVRLANGRFVRVQVGDRVDGGQVAAIGDRELRYVKGGRDIVLEMPRG